MTVDTPARKPQQEYYLVSTEELNELALYFREHKYPHIAKAGGAIISAISDRPHTSPPAPELPSMNSTELLLIAHDEWKNREERKHIHPEDHWIAGWLNGVSLGYDYLQSRIDKIRKGAKGMKHE
jgi:hypothetical protein